MTGCLLGGTLRIPNHRDPNQRPGSVGMLFAVWVVVHMAIRVPMNFFWRWAADADFALGVNGI